MDGSAALGSAIFARDLGESEEMVKEVVQQRRVDERLYSQSFRTASPQQDQMLKKYMVVFE